MIYDNNTLRIVLNFIFKIIFMGFAFGIINNLIQKCNNPKPNTSSPVEVSEIDSITKETNKLIIEVDNLDSIKNAKIIEVKKLDNDSTLKLFYQLISK